MNINNYYKIKNKSKSKKIISIFILFTILILSNIYGYNKYHQLINTFKNDFEKYKFSEANNLLLTTQNFNPFKLIMLNKDISKYFNNKVSTLSEDIINKKISSEDALIQINEINRYNVVNSGNLTDLSTSIDLIRDSIKNYTEGVNYYNNENYVDAISCFKKVSSLDLNYAYSITYLNNSKNRLKANLLAYCDNLIQNDHYTDALSKLSANSNILGNDADIEEKTSYIKAKQQEYIDKTSAIAEASSRALTAIISSNNINTLNIESNTSYFINVDLKNQKTYIYKGKSNNWSLIKTCPCSTGLNGEDTPSGSFSTKEHGDWFFSEKYAQGGKYWTQITGDILFHSLPFAKDKTTILDYTLNKPSSHGCIRLSIDDAKWIYGNVPKGSKVIIK